MFPAQSVSELDSSPALARTKMEKEEWSESEER